MRIFEDLNVRFVQSRRKAYVFSAVLLLVGIGSLVTRGVELGIDFSGGMEFVVEVDGDPSVTAVRDALGAELGAVPEVKAFGEGALLVRTGGEMSTTEAENRIVQVLASDFGGTNPRVVKTDTVGPRFAEDLKGGALKAVLASLFVILVYISIRFEWRFGVGAVAALFHDVTITLGIFSLLHGLVPFSLQVDQALIAAFLTIVGYSLNDTVVIFDRIREYSILYRAEPYLETVNRSINRTMSRTIVTSGTTLLVVITLFIFGGEVLKGFAFALIIGILIGTYSSIFVAAPVVVELRARFATSRKR